LSSHETVFVLGDLECQPVKTYMDIGFDPTTNS